jgi:hypothetical protein
MKTLIRVPQSRLLRTSALQGMRAVCSDLRSQQPCVVFLRPDARSGSALSPISASTSRHYRHHNPFPPRRQTPSRHSIPIAQLFVAA